MGPDPERSLIIAGGKAAHGCDERLWVGQVPGDAHAAYIILDRLRARDDEFTGKVVPGD